MAPRVVRYKIEIEGTGDITERLAGRVAGFTLTDGKHARDDGATLELIDFPEPIAWPEHGKKIQFSVALPGEPFVPLGPQLKLDTPVSSGPPRMLSVRCNTIPPPRPRRPGVSSEEGASMGDSQTRNLLTESNVPNTLANFAYLHRGQGAFTDVVIAADVMELPVEGGQRDETAGQLWARMAQDHRLSVRVRDGVLHVSQLHTATSARTGRPITTLTVDTATDLISWSGFELASRAAEVRSVMARWHNVGAGTSGAVTEGRGRPRHVDRHVYEDEASARNAAQQRMRGFAADARKGSVVVFGKPFYAAHGRIEFSEEIRPGVGAGTWCIAKAAHHVTGDGVYTTALDLEGV